MYPPLRRATAAVLGVVMMTATLTGCGRSTEQNRWSDPIPPKVSGGGGAAATAPGSGPAAAEAPGGSAATAGTPGRAQGRAPSTVFAVGVRQLPLSRGADRPLPTRVWYPAASRVTGTAPAAAPRAAPAAGRFPVVLFSHGLTGSPEEYAGLTTRLASAGFVVAAPAYPYTSKGAPSYNPLDVFNQPADAWYVIGQVLALNTTAGDPLAGHLDPARVAAVGHSAGGYTTAGMLGVTREAPLAGAVIIAGGIVGTFAGPSTPVLFIHGDQDPTVTYGLGRAAYDAVPWPKAFLTLVNAGHVGFLAPGAKGFEPTVRTTTDFLRWSLYGDPAAKARLAADGTADRVARTELALG